MKRIWPIIAVSDVVNSVDWYKNLLDAMSTHPDGTTFDQIVDTDGTVLLCLHCWGPSGASGTHEWPTLLVSGESDPNGLLLWFVVDDFDQAWKRAKRFGAKIVEEPNTDNGTGEQAFVVCDPDGYHVVINKQPDTDNA
ncbi:MAG: glyoxalase [Phototrophicales bacterium]|nr:MAG: glyoxalase [Phototrophicales bacterium]